MADDARLAELRGLLAEALRATGVWWAEDTDGPADRLLPVVSAWAEQHAARRAAEEVRRIANDPALSTVTHTANFGLPARVVPVASLYGVADLLARAAALTPATEEER